MLAVLAACSERPTARPEVAADTAERNPWVDLPALPCAAASDTVTGDGVGPVRAGAPAREARRCPASDTTLSLGNGVPERALVVSVAGGVVIALTAGGDTTGSGDTVTRVIVPAPGFRTAGGIGVGNTVGELRRAHGPVCGDIGEGAVVVAAQSLPGVSFQTSTDYASVVPRQAELRPAAAPVPDTAHITQLWAVGAGKGLCR